VRACEKFAQRLPFSYWEETNTVMAYFIIGRTLLIHPTPDPSPYRGGEFLREITPPLIGVGNRKPLPENKSLFLRIDACFLMKRGC